MKIFNRVAIIGTGLIGGSIALAIKKKRLANEVIGISRHRKTLRLAKQNRAIDKGSQDFKIVRDADLIIFATPISTILKLAPKVAKIVKPDSIVTDVGSTKGEIVSKLEKLFSGYVGSHPLAGSEKRGIIHARADIFKNTLCILTPTKNMEPKALAKIKKLWQQLGAKVIILPPNIHDKALSFVSHLPHVVAFSLIDIIPKAYLEFGSSGLKDTTRIAASDSELWSDIFFSNQKNILASIELFEGALSKIKSAIQKKDRKLLDRILRQAKIKRQSLG